MIWHFFYSTLRITKFSRFFIITTIFFTNGTHLSLQFQNENEIPVDWQRQRSPKKNVSTKYEKRIVFETNKFSGIRLKTVHMCAHIDRIDFAIDLTSKKNIVQPKNRFFYISQLLLFYLCFSFILFWVYVEQNFPAPSN